MMARGARHLGWLAWLAICTFVLLFATSVLAVVSMFFPYVPSHEVSSFCYYILPFILFLLLMGVGLAGNLLAKRGGGHSMAFQENWVGPMFSGTILSILWALMMSVVPAIPTKYLADHTVDEHVIVSKVSGFRSNYGHFVWIYYKQGDLNGKFMWTRTGLVNSMGNGDCIILHGRKWLFGFYADVISKSNDCESKWGQVHSSSAP